MSKESSLVLEMRTHAGQDRGEELKWQHRQLSAGLVWQEAMRMGSLQFGRGWYVFREANMEGACM